MEMNSREEDDPFSPGLRKDIFGWWGERPAGQVKLIKP